MMFEDFFIFYVGAVIVSALAGLCSGMVIGYILGKKDANKRV